MNSKVLIIGSGPAGYTAAIYAARAGLEPVVVAGDQPGGQLTVTTDVENYPGFPEVIYGPWLMEQMKQQALNMAARIIWDHIAAVDFSVRPFKLQAISGCYYTADAVIICTGAQAKWLGLESEKKFIGFGVSSCATCDGFFYRNKKVIVVGGGNTAVEESLYLTRYVSSVTLVHRRDSLRAEKVLQDKLFMHSKIKVLWNTVLEEVLGTDQPLGVNGARLRSTNSEVVNTVETDGIFIAIGHAPNTAIFRGQLDMDHEGYIITKPGTAFTNVPGVFAAGDVQDKVYRQAVTAAGSGCVAALDAARYLAL